MKNSDYRIPDDMAAEVLAESARLYAEANKGYSFADLQQACADIQIPPHIVKQAISNVEEKRSSDRLKHQQFRDYLKIQINKGIRRGFALLVPAIAVSSIFIFRHQLKPAIGGMISHLNPSIKTLTVEEGKLIYLTDPKGLSISVHNGNGINATIGMDGYNNLEICPVNDDKTSNPKPIVDSCHSGKLGDSYEYQGIYNYRIKIIEIKGNSIVFEIEQISNEPKSLQSSLSQSQQEVNELRKERKKSQIKIKEFQQQIENSKGEIKTLEGRLENSKGEIKTLEGQIESFRESDARK